MKNFDYAAPSSIDEVNALMAENSTTAMLLAGGTDLVVGIKKEMYQPQLLVSTKNIVALQGIEFGEDNVLRVGAATTLSEIENSAVIKEKYPALSQAAGSVASCQIRNHATIGGNICLNSRCSYYNQSGFWKKAYPDCRKSGGHTCYVVKGGTRCYAVFSADTVPALIALNASIEISGIGGCKIVSLQDFYSGSGEVPNVLRHHELVTEVIIPFQPERHTYFLKYQNRQSIDFAQLTLGVSALHNCGTWEDQRIVVGGVDSGPVRLSETECLWQSMVQGTGVDFVQIGASAAKEMKVFNTYNGAAAYKKKVVQKLVGQAVREIMAQ